MCPAHCVSSASVAQAFQVAQALLPVRSCVLPIVGALLADPDVGRVVNPDAGRAAPSLRRVAPSRPDHSALFASPSSTVIFEDRDAGKACHPAEIDGWILGVAYALGMWRFVDLKSRPLSKIPGSRRAGFRDRSRLASIPSRTAPSVSMDLSVASGLEIQRLAGLVPGFS